MMLGEKAVAKHQWFAVVLVARVEHGMHLFRATPPDKGQGVRFPFRILSAMMTFDFTAKDSS
mgnify:CR=1 FL=1